MAKKKKQTKKQEVQKKAKLKKRKSASRKKPSAVKKGKTAEVSAVSEVRAEAPARLKSPGFQDVNDILNYLENTILPQARTMPFQGMVPIMENGKFTLKKVNTVQELEGVIQMLKNSQASLALPEGVGLPVTNLPNITESTLNNQETKPKQQGLLGKITNFFKQGLLGKITNFFKQ